MKLCFALSAIALLVYMYSGFMVFVKYMTPPPMSVEFFAGAGSLTMCLVYVGIICTLIKERRKRAAK